MERTKIVFLSDIHMSNDAEYTVICFPDKKQNITVGEVRNHYHGLFKKECDKSGFRMLNCISVSLQKKGLDWYAKYLLKNSEGKAIVSGHTHHREWNHLCMKGYVNDGCWCSHSKDKSPAYVEVKINPKNIDMSLWEWYGFRSKKLGSRKVSY